MHTNGVKKTIPLGFYGKQNANNYANSKEIQKNYFSSKHSISQTAGHNGFEVICKVRIIPTVTYGE